ncbi:TrmO family methyltransferase, partial [Breznakia sp. OttesenSCG-928-G09]|nr:TrmO family methyltransferase [Breznakia sp. OttesenSCG-928-G09]
MRDPYKLTALGKMEANRTRLDIIEKYRKGLKNLSFFSHVILFYGKEDIDVFDESLCSVVLKIDALDEKSGWIDFESPLTTTITVYDIKPYFPCEDRVRNAVYKDNGIGCTYKEDNFIGYIIKEEGRCFLHFNNGLQQMLPFLQQGTHLKIQWWFHKYEKAMYRNSLEGDPPYENAPRTGIFASRSPVRMNPIALTTVKILGYDESQNRIEVSKLDAFDKTPILALSMYNPEKDFIDNPMVPYWLEHWPMYVDDTRIDTDTDLVDMKSSTQETLEMYQLETPLIEIEDIYEEEINSMMRKDVIQIMGARVNNLKGIHVDIPHQQITTIMGVSGSGKSSLAFDTIFAESQHRFLENMSFQERSAKQAGRPEVDAIYGLPPAIAISQTNKNRNPRSTVGTMSNIDGLIRLLYSNVGIRHCPKCGNEVHSHSAEEIVDLLKQCKPTTQVKIKAYKSQTTFAEFTILPTTDENYISFSEMLQQSIKESLSLGKGVISVVFNKHDEVVFQTTQMCYDCDYVFFELTPSTFCFNNSESACPVCNGTGQKAEVSATCIITNPEKSILDGASPFWGNLRKFRKNPNANWMKGEVLALALELNEDLEKPWCELSDSFKEQAMYGTDMEVTFSYENKNGRSGHITRKVEGAYHIIKRLYHSSSRETARKIAEQYMHEQRCPSCHGERLSKEARLISIGGIRYPEV